MEYFFPMKIIFGNKYIIKINLPKNRTNFIKLKS